MLACQHKCIITNHLPQAPFQENGAELFLESLTTSHHFL